MTTRKQAVLLRRRRAASLHASRNALHFENEHLLSTNGAPLPLRTVRHLMNVAPRALCRVIVEPGARRNHGYYHRGLVSSGTGMLVKLPSLSNEDDGRGYCGLLTNNHVLDEHSVRQQCWRLVFDEMNLRVDADHPKLGQVLFGSSRLLDFTFLYLPECKLFKEEDYLPVAPERSGMRIVVVQHPNGGELSLSYGEIIGLNGADLYHTADTMGGSSGSPLLNEFGHVVGLHKAGSPITNVATRMTYITQALAQSTSLINDFRRPEYSPDPRENNRLDVDDEEETDSAGDDHRPRGSSPPPAYSPPNAFPLRPAAPGRHYLHMNARTHNNGHQMHKRNAAYYNRMSRKATTVNAPFYDDLNLATLMMFYDYPMHAHTRGSTGRDLEMFEYELSKLAVANRGLLLPRLKQAARPGGCFLTAACSNGGRNSDTRQTRESTSKILDDDGHENDEASSGSVQFFALNDSDSERQDSVERVKIRCRRRRVPRIERK